MIEIDITNDMVENALDRANDIGHLNNSITSGQGNLAGIIGEDIVKDYIGGNINNTYDYDVVKDNVLYVRKKIFRFEYIVKQTNNSRIL